MGQMADDMIDGTTCSWCGCYFMHPTKKDHLYTHEYPAVCHECYRDWKEYDGGTKAKLTELGLQIALVGTR